MAGGKETGQAGGRNKRGDTSETPRGTKRTSHRPLFLLHTALLALSSSRVPWWHDGCELPGGIYIWGSGGGGELKVWGGSKLLQPHFDTGGAFSQTRAPRALCLKS